MIYIITPFLQDFMKVCEKENLNCPVQRGMPLNRHVLWLHHWMQLEGRKIFKVDKVFYGEQINHFDPDMLKRIENEIHLRRITSE